MSLPAPHPVADFSPGQPSRHRVAREAGGVPTADPGFARPAAHGFTLIEIMIVMGIAAMIMAIGLPSFVTVLKKDPMRQAVTDVLEACSRARAQAILNGVTAELHFRPGEFSFQTSLAATPSEPGQGVEGGQTGPDAPRPVNAPGFSGHLSDQLTLEMLDVNFKEYKDEEEARVRFFPNGTCDEFTIVISWPAGSQYRKITLDIITGLADVESIR